MAEYVKMVDHSTMYIADFNDSGDTYNDDDVVLRYRFVYWDDYEGSWWCHAPGRESHGSEWLINHPPYVQTNYSTIAWNHCADCMALCWDDYLCHRCRARIYA